MDVTSTRRSAGAAGLWSKADFRRLWGADVISRLGDATTVLALPLAAIVALLHQTMVIGTVGLYLMVIPYLVSPVHRLRSLPEPDEGHDPA